MGGMEMMLKAFGLDPKEIGEQITQFATYAKAGAEAMERIEAKLDAAIQGQAAIELRLDRIDAALRRAYDDEARTGAIIQG